MPDAYWTEKRRFKICPIGVVHFEYFRADAFGSFRLVSCFSFRFPYSSYSNRLVAGVVLCTHSLLIAKWISNWSKVLARPQLDFIACMHCSLSCSLHVSWLYDLRHVSTSAVDVQCNATSANAFGVVSCREKNGIKEERYKRRTRNDRRCVQRFRSGLVPAIRGPGCVWPVILGEGGISGRIHS